MTKYKYMHDSNHEISHHEQVKNEDIANSSDYKYMYGNNKNIMYIAFKHLQDSLCIGGHTTFSQSKGMVCKFCNMASNIISCY